jgi:hypothetical protein
MSLPRPGYDYCPSCLAEAPDACRCSRYCAECRAVTNHSTRMHRDAEDRCSEPGCDRPVEDGDESRRCRSCQAEYLSELAEYYTPDEGGNG